MNRQQHQRGAVIPVAGALAVAMKTEKMSIASKARKINEVLSRLWYIVLNCIPNEQHITGVNGLVNNEATVKSEFLPDIQE